MNEDRTFQPTAKRRQLARQEGRVTASTQVVGALLWLGIAVAGVTAGPWILTHISNVFESLWLQPWNTSSDDLVDHIRQSIAAIGVYWWSLLGLMFAVAIVGRLAQIGFLFVPTRVTPDINRLNPRQRAIELFSADKLFQMLRGIGLIFCALLLVVVGIWDQRESLLRLVTASNFEQETVRLISNWGLRLGGCLAVFSIADYGYQRYRFEMSLRMSGEELRAEIQAVEGNPQVTAERKGMHQQLRTQRDSASPHD